MDYDASKDVPAHEWLALDEEARVRAVERHHVELGAAHAPSPKPRLHAALHVVVEDQLALRDPPEVAAALQRLRREGLSRHDAVHAISGVAAEHALAALSGQGKFDRGAYLEALETLSAERYRAELRRTRPS